MQKVIQHATDVGIKSTDFVQAGKNNLWFKPRNGWVGVHGSTVEQWSMPNLLRHSVTGSCGWHTADGSEIWQAAVQVGSFLVPTIERVR